MLLVAQLQFDVHIFSQLTTEEDDRIIYTCIFLIGMTEKSYRTIFTQNHSLILNVFVN